MSTTPETAKQRTRVHPPTADITADDMFESLTGFDELAIKERWGVPVNDLVRTDQIQLGRALVFVHLRRTGAKDRDAYKTAQEMTVGEAVDYFSDDLEADLPDDLAEPVTDQGKDAGRHVVRLESSPIGV